MKNNVLKLIKYLYYFSLIALLILYLFPGSLIGYFFYGDFGKIGLVLGSGFVRPKQKQREPFADFDYDDKDGLNRDFYELINMNEKGFDFKQSINSLFNNESEA